MSEYEWPKLESPYNFKAWMRGLKTSLMLEGLWEHVHDGTPAILDPPSPTAVGYDTFPDSEAIEHHKAWQAKDCEAKILICASLAHGHMAMEAGLPTKNAHTVFNNLVEKCNIIIKVSKYRLYRSWIGLQWDGTYLEDFLDKWYTAIMDCRDAGIEVLTFVAMVANCGDETFEH
ncbi:hypothetical protein BKA80DRAFT_341314 [Phyllosticta citrichinensis]